MCSIYKFSLQYIYHKKTYGTSIKASKSLIISSIVENPEILKYQQSKQQEERVKKAKLLQQNIHASAGLVSPVGKHGGTALGEYINQVNVTVFLPGVL